MHEDHRPIRVEDLTIEDILAFLGRVRCRFKHRCPSRRVADFKLTLSTKGAKMPLSATSGQTVNGIVSGFVDAAGNATMPSAPPIWSSSDTNVLDMIASADGLTASGVAKAAGSATISVNADGVVKSDTVEVAPGPVVDFALALSIG